jgi:hypothetical protein
MVSVLQQLYKENKELSKRIKALEEGFVYYPPIEEISQVTEVESQKKKGVSRFISFLRKK